MYICTNRDRVRALIHQSLKRLEEKDHTQYTRRNLGSTEEVNQKQGKLDEREGKQKSTSSV
jgi:hypothetical protein